MLYLTLLSLLAASLVYFGVYHIGSRALQEIYLSPESRAARQAEIYSEFYRYVTLRQIAGTDENAVAQWVREHAYVTILVYGDETLNQRAGTQLPAPAARYGQLRDSGGYGRLYPMRFADGVYRIAIVDSSSVREDNINRLIAVLLGAITFVCLMLLYIRRLTSRIIRLSREAAVIGAGELDAPITVRGEDELSMLGREMDGMRRSVIERMSGERRAWEANSELITAVSHDIRTPMTALIGYLGLLNENLSDAEKSRQFASSAYGKAMELKDLTDELFKYFLVFGRAELELNRETLDARLLLEQLLGEAEFELHDAGFTVRRQDFEGECAVCTDPLYLKRVVDNLVSNAKKYADRAAPLLLLCEKAGGCLTVCFSNTIAKNAPRVESTKIGLRTCEKIMSALGGSFEVKNDGEHFAAEFTLPVEAENPS